MKKIILTLISVVVTVSMVFAQSFSTSGLEKISDKVVHFDKSEKGMFFITHSLDQSIGTNSVSCNSGGYHTDNSYFRLFDLVTEFGINEDIQISSVEFGVQEASSSGGTQPVHVNVYTLVGTFELAHLTLIASEEVQVVDQASVILDVPITAFIPQGSILVVEIFTPEGQTAGNKFFIGSNALGQTGPSYIVADDCGVSEPTPIEDLGFTNHYVINVNADLPVSVPINNWAIILSFLLISSFILIRTRV